MLADIVVDLQYGDSGKGKITHHLCKSGDYTHVLRYNGGCNAGHTIYHEGKKFVTHHIPAGVFFGIKSIIGSGCVVNPVQFFSEIEELEANGIKTKGLIFIAKNAHVITAAHLEEDSTDKVIGTTKQGNGPAYRDKYARTGLLAKDIPSFEPYLVDLFEEFHNAETPPRILCEGAQGFGLDIDHGDYPYVTSSHCTTAGALLNAILLGGSATYGE
jgi:adenylosuccinate synthase